MSPIITCLENDIYKAIANGTPQRTPSNTSALIAGKSLHFSVTTQRTYSKD